MAACGCQMSWTISQGNCLQGSIQALVQAPCTVNGSLRRSNAHTLSTLWQRGLPVHGNQVASVGTGSSAEQGGLLCQGHPQPAVVAGSLEGEQAGGRVERVRRSRSRGSAAPLEAHLDSSHGVQDSGPPQTSAHGHALGLQKRSLHALRGDHMSTRAQASPRRTAGSDSALMDAERLPPGKLRGRGRPRSKWRTLEVVRDSSVDELEELYASAKGGSRARPRGPQQADGAKPRALIEELLSDGELRLVEDRVGSLPPSVEELGDIGGQALTANPRGHGEDADAFELEDEGSFATAESDGAEVWIGREEVLPELAVERPGGRRVMELVAAWDALAPRLAAESVRSSAAQLLIAALKLTLPALQDALPAEGGRSRTARALAIASTLADLRMDAETIAAGLVREAVEAGTLSIAAVELQLGVAVGRLLHDSQRVQRSPQRADSLDDASAAALRQFCLGFHDARAVIVELAACLDSMRHLAPLPRWRQQIVALETLQVWAPLAHALGTGSLMWELEDRAFHVLFPHSYQSMAEWLEGQYPKGDHGVEECRHALEAALKADAELASLVQGVAVAGRRKSLYSTMKKLLRDGRSRHEVHDLLGLRVVLTPRAGGGAEEQRERGRQACYVARQVAARLWLEIPERFKDYVAYPKRNNYQSLHMAVHLGPEERGPPVEVQIRTAEMDALAVHGVAAHGAYKGGLTDPQQVQQLRAIVQAMADVAAAQYTTSPGQEADSSSRRGGVTVEVDVDVKPEAEWGETDHMFAMFDRNGDGRISMEEVRTVISEVSADARGNPEDAEELMALLDSNNDGSISAAEFAEFRRRVRLLRDLPGVDRQYWEELGDCLQMTEDAGGREPSSPGTDRERNGLEEVPQQQARTEKGQGAGVAQALVQDEPRASSAFQAVAASQLRLLSGSGEDLQQLAGEASGSGDHSSAAVAGSSGRHASASASRMAPHPHDRSSGLPTPEETSTVGRQPAELRQGGSELELGEEVGGQDWDRVYAAATAAEFVESSSSAGGAGSLEDRSQDGSSEMRVGEANGALAHSEPPTSVAASGESLVQRNGALLSESNGGAAVAAMAGSSSWPEGSPNGAASAVVNGALKGHALLPQPGMPALVDGPRPADRKGHVALHRSPQLSQVSPAAVAAPAEVELEVEEVVTEHPEVDEEEVNAQLASVRNMMKQRTQGLAKARLVMQELVKQHPLHPNVWVHYAQLERKAGNVGAARSRYEQSVKAFEFWGDHGAQYLRCLQAWGTLEAESCRVQEARSLFRAALLAASRREAQGVVEVAEAAVVALHSWAMLEQRQGSWARARQLLERAASLQPGNAVVLQSRALLEKRAHNWALARHYFERASRAAPEDAACWQAWAIFEAQQGKVAKMRMLFKRALDADPRSLHALQAWAHQEALLATEESRQRARELYRCCTEVAPDAVYGWQAWAVLEQQAGDLAAARELFEKGLQVAPANVTCLQGYALLEKQCGNLRAAQDLLALALAAEPANAAALMAAAQVEEELGHESAAQELFVRAGLADRAQRRRKRRMFEERKAQREEAAAAGESGQGGKAPHLKGGRGDRSSTPTQAKAGKPAPSPLKGRWRTVGQKSTEVGGISA